MLKEYRSGNVVDVTEMFNRLGARTIGTSGSAEKLARLSAVGLEVPIATRKPDFGSKVREVTAGKGADVIVNLVGGTIFAECIGCLALRGRLAVVGYVDGALKAEIDLGAVHANRHEIFGISNAKMTVEERAAAMSGFARDVLPAIVDGRITPLVDKVFEFGELQAAKDWMESSAMTGKIVVRGI